ncbi:amidohydrolase family protein [Pacificimonas sp. WHA3]|uniref:Amidohydrolase family protein n=1 Tax=Pacificimonas pallii TaxID=2827236 RepID=A0ABS6SGG2_9SPHN|nr:amidohydrolase family protein [Pacificimonas pallii]MBV7257133.1 amidohydrolase family protein [Pacificimonas pallii]
MIHFRRVSRAFISAWALCVSASAFADEPVQTAEEPTPYDVIIRNGRVLDGSGSPWVLADIAIKDGRIARIGRIPGRADHEINAEGKYVSPGWIDAMDQSGEEILANGLAQNKLAMGVTTLIAGEAGIPATADKIGDYFGTLRERGISVNFATYYSATQARVEVIGDTSRAPTPDEMCMIRGKVETAMEAGALGLTTALIYPPGVFQTTDELVEIVSAAAPYDGIYATHMRDEGANLLAGIEEAIEIGERAGVKVEIFHLKAGYRPGWGTLMTDAGKLIDAARDRGVDIAADMYPYTAGGTGLDVAIPPEIFAGGPAAAFEKLRDRAFRAKLIERIRNDEFGEWSKANVVVASGGWDGVVLADAHSATYEAYAGRTIADVAEALGEDPYELAIKIVLSAYPKRAFGFFFMMSEEDVRTALRFPWTSIGSDAGISVDAHGMPSGDLSHPRANGTFPRIISEYVRDNPVLSLAEAIRKMTAWPASRHGFNDRGILREGLPADITVFDLATIKDKATWTDGAAMPVGVEHVFVNGVHTLRNGQHTGARGGMVLRGGGAASISRGQAAKQQSPGVRRCE